MDLHAGTEMYRKSYIEALKHNEKVLNQVQSFRKGLGDVCTNLEENQKHLFRNIMVPLGSKALIKGKLMHTNEVFVNLGDRWFVKTSAARAGEICKRMMKRCEDNIVELEKETKLLTSNLEMPQEFGIFDDDDVKEIIEPYDEEYEKQWREKHKERVKEYKKQQALNKISDEEIFKNIDELETNDNQEVSDDCDDYEEESEDEDKSFIEHEEHSHNELPVQLQQSEFSESELSFQQIPKKNSETEISRCHDTNYSPTSEMAVKKRVSFSDTDSIQLHSSSVNEDETYVIRFKHSNSEPKHRTYSDTDEIISPSDIYQKCVKQMTRKPILKNKNEITYTNEKYLPPNQDESSQFYQRDTVEVLGDIVEKTPTVPQKSDTETRPMSKFKLARTRNQ